MILKWTGSDVYYMHTFPKQWPLYKWPYILALRLFAYIADRYIIQRHQVVSEHLIHELRMAIGATKPVEVQPNDFAHGKVNRAKEKIFYVAYYIPISHLQWRREWYSWLYGIDLIVKLMKELRPMNIHFLPIYFSNGVYAGLKYADVYIRPNRHDGNSRLVRAFQYNDIPVWYSVENPNYTALKEWVIEQYNKKHGKQTQDSQVRPNETL